MTALRSSALALAVVLSLGATAALAQSMTYQQFTNAVGKYARDPSGTPKVLCVCMDGGVDDGLAGVLVRLVAGTPSFRNIRVACRVLDFSETTGGISGSSTCAVWVPLAK